jgi:molybdopterin synthase catalytic subunit
VSAACSVSVQPKPFDAGAEIAALTRGRDDVGAVVCFTGRVRADGGVLAIELEHYPGMTEKALADMAAEAARRWELTGVRLVHRVGRLAVGEDIVLAATASVHRRAAFEACEFLMDWLKTRAPFWKREITVEGARWVEAKSSDATAAARWQEG